MKTRTLLLTLILLSGMTLPMLGQDLTPKEIVRKADENGAVIAAMIGIQIMIPQWFGPVPMRFEIAAPFIKDNDDDERVFSFSVGSLF